MITPPDSGHASGREDADPAETGYMVVYARNVQEGPPDYPFDQFYDRVTPIHVVEIHGVPYVWIYQVRQPVPRRMPG